MKLAMLPSAVVFLIAAQAADLRAQRCDQTFVGMRPLDDLGTDTWKGEVGGLYPGGLNVRPDPHDAAGRALARTVVPLDSNGQPSTTGQIGLAAIGMSVTSIFFDGFASLLALESGIAPEVALANLTTNGKTAEDLSDPNDPYWLVDVPADLAASGLTADQVQVVWVFVGNWIRDRRFPDHALQLTSEFVLIAQILHDVFPNLQLAFVDSIQYMGYSASGFASEPEIGEQSFSVKWLIEGQIAGDSELNFDPRLGPVRAPWLSWGPMFWADGILPRSDGLTWECADYIADGQHPSGSGALKGARLLLHLFESDPVATPWFLDSGAGAAGHPANVELYGVGTVGTAGEPSIAVSQLPTIPTKTSLDLLTALGRPDSSGLFLMGTDALDVGVARFAGGWLLVLPRWFIPVVTDGRGIGRSVLAAVPDDPALADLVVYAQLALRDPLGPTGTFSLSRGIEILLGD